MTERKNLFYVLSLLGFIISFILILQTNGETFRSFFYYGHDYFMDFFNHIWYVRDRAHVYDSSIYEMCIRDRSKLMRKKSTVNSR